MQPRRRPGRLALAAALVAIASPAAAQNRDAGAADAATRAGADAAAIRQTATRAQAEFERRRLWLLPRAYGGGDRCDVRIGRYCYWYDESAPPGPVEPVRIGQARRELLATLDSAARELPDDEWIAGQRVRYWVEAGAADTALRAAGDCAAGGWWCVALAGYALHAAGDAGAADSAFDAALRAMPADERCRWQSIAPLLDNAARERYERLPCPARDTLERRFWWLATPWLSRAGNDRRNEHFARHVLSRVNQESRSTYSERWGRDLHELLVRYGWPDRWARRDATSTDGDATVVGYEPSPAYRWSAAPDLLHDPYTATPASWPLRDREALARYAPAFARTVHDAAVSAAVLRRGDSLLVVAAFRVRGGALLTGGRAAAALVLAREGGAPVVVRDTLRGATGLLTATVATAPHLLSVELLGDSATGARARLGVHPPTLDASGFGVSDLVLHAPAASDSEATLPDVLARPLAADEVTTPARLGVYWEVYGLAAGRHELRTTLHVGSARPGWATRVWERLRRTPPRSPVALGWTDVPVADGGPVGRAVTVELPALPAGRYDVELRVRASGGREATARRTVVVSRRGYPLRPSCARLKEPKASCEPVSPPG